MRTLQPDHQTTEGQGSSTTLELQNCRMRCIVSTTNMELGRFGKGKGRQTGSGRVVVAFVLRVPLHPTPPSHPLLPLQTFESLPCSHHPISWAWQ